jgi:hypothetical protein
LLQYVPPERQSKIGVGRATLMAAKLRGKMVSFAIERASSQRKSATNRGNPLGVAKFLSKN